MSDIVHKIAQTKRGGNDKVFDEDMKPKDFVFDEKVASVFDDMVSRSVPMYKETMAAAMGLAKNFVQNNSAVYDIGCSTCTLLLNFAELISENDVKLVGIDNSAAMLEQARSKLEELGVASSIDLMKKDVEGDMSIRDASVVFMNYTLQFVRPLHRESVLKQIYNGLKPNGCLILVEKVLGNDSLYNRLYIDLYYQYKAQVGYTEKEIQQKREALENVLIPYRIDENLDLLKRCGFTSKRDFLHGKRFR